MSDELAEKVQSVIASSKRIPREQVSLDSTLESLGMDSLDQLNLLFALESDFNISIPDEEAKRLKLTLLKRGLRRLVHHVQYPPSLSERLGRSATGGPEDVG